MPRLCLALAAVLIIPFLVSTAHADPAGKTTLRGDARARRRQRLPRPATGQGGENYVVRRGGSAKAKAKRDRASGARCVNFVQLTDPQIADEMSPARVDFADPAGGELKSSWRPQEALGLQVFDSVVRNVNANRSSRVKQGNGKRARSRRSRSPRATSPTTSSSTRRAGSRPCSTAAASTRSPASRSPTECGNQSADDARAHQRRRRGPQLHRRRRLRRLPRRAGRPLRRLLRPGRGRADRRPVRGVPALPRPARGRPAPVPGGRPGHALVHLARQPRRPRPGQRARQRGPLPRDRRRLPEGVPQRGVRPEALRGRRAPTSCSPPSATRTSSRS